jgi:hypothetical protein
MTTTLEESSAAIRAAASERMAATPADDPKMVGYVSPTTKPRHNVASTEEMQSDRLLGDGIASETYAEWVPPFQPQTPAEQTLHHALNAVRDRHGKYGPPTEHFARTASLVNAAFGTTFSAADWALVMVLDKVARQLGTQATDDAAIDIAGYAACHQECRRG